jgi:hypothetical protein
LFEEGGDVVVDVLDGVATGVGTDGVVVIDGDVGEVVDGDIVVLGEGEPESV